MLQCTVRARVCVCVHMCLFRKPLQFIVMRVYALTSDSSLCLLFWNRQINLVDALAKRVIRVCGFDRAERMEANLAHCGAMICRIHTHIMRVDRFEAERVSKPYGYGGVRSSHIPCVWVKNKGTWAETWKKVKKNVMTRAFSQPCSCGSS